MAARKIPDWEKEKRADLRERYGGMMNLTQVQRELGALSPKTARAWLSGLTHSKVGKQKKWAIEDVAPADAGKADHCGAVGGPVLRLEGR